MPTWGQLLQELQRLQRTQGAQPLGAPTPFDILRRKYLKELSTLTGRATIVYATAWMEPKTGVDPNALAITLSDVQGFMEAVSGVKERELDLFLHSPGGSAEAAESILEYLRSQFDHIRAIIPVAAMSAATMLALGADELIMGTHSQLGPIDPQFTLSTPEGPRSAPAQAIRDQFEMAKEECQDPDKLPAWLPILRGYMPGLLAQCGHQLELAVKLVETWLARYMFKDLPEKERTERAHEVAEWFSDFGRFKSHGRRVGLEDVEAQKLNVIRLDDHEHQDAILSVHHAFRLTMAQTPTTKIIENHNGRAMIEMAQQIPMMIGTQPMAPPMGAPGGPVALPAPGARPQGNRQQQRAQQRQQAKKNR